MRQAAAETCANCGAMIGKLEEPCIWKDHVVCRKCHDKLSLQPAPQPVLEQDIPDFSNLIGDDDRKLPLDYEAKQRFIASASSTASSNPDFIICPNPHCGFKGMGLRRPKGSRIILILLLLLWILPGILYLIFYNGYTISCPICGVKVRDA